LFAVEFSLLLPGTRLSGTAVNIIPSLRLWQIFRREIFKFQASATMPDFLGVWLPLWICTWIAAVVQYVSHRNHGFVTVITFLVAEFGALVIWAFYGMVLYPRYFTPFRQLPTPPVRISRDSGRDAS
jgi:hypothetical protein